MRLAVIIAPALVLGFGAPNASAADATGGAGPSGLRFDREAPPPPSLRGGFLSEARFGVFALDPFPEDAEQSASLHGEILFNKPFTPADLFASYFVPRPHLGGSLAFDGTSFAFAGFTWSVDLGPQFFVEASLGGALQETRASAYAATRLDDGVAAGCGPSLRESASVGYRLTDTWSLVASVERVSNDGLCDQPTSMTNFGARLGYSF